MPKKHKGQFKILYLDGVFSYKNVVINQNCHTLSFDLKFLVAVITSQHPTGKDEDFSF